MQLCIEPQIFRLIVPPNSKVWGSLLERGTVPGWMGGTRMGVRARGLDGWHADGSWGPAVPDGWHADGTGCADRSLRSQYWLRGRVGGSEDGWHGWDPRHADWSWGPVWEGPDEA